MIYNKTIKNGYIICAEKRTGNDITGNSSAEEYAAICNAILNKPVDPEGFCYRLKIDLTWELCELSLTVDVTDPELTAEEALNIIVGGGDNA